MSCILYPPYRCGIIIYNKSSIFYIVTTISDGTHAIFYFSTPLLRPITYHKLGWALHTPFLALLLTGLCSSWAKTYSFSCFFTLSPPT